MKALSATELRIGNLVYYHIKDEMDERVEWDEINTIDVDDLRFLTDFENNSEYKPIPLTEEWLLKAGFEKDDTGVDMFDQDYYEWYQKEFPVIGILCQSSDKEYIFDENTDTLRLKFVHELQNLYFALTGEELTIKI